MRPWILLSLVACAEPLRPPPQLPPDPNAVNGCRSAPTSLGGVRYTCSTYVVHDNAMEDTSLRSIELHLVTEARAKGIDSTTRMLDVAGAEAALIIEYRQRGRHAFDLLVANPVDTRTRLLQCHVPWFENASSLPTRQETCSDTIAQLLKRPPPPGREISDACKQATMQLPNLPGRTDPPDGSDELRVTMREFAARCTEKIAACALAAATYVEATLCWD